MLSAFLRSLALSLALAVLPFPAVAEAGSLGKAVGSGAARGLARRASPPKPRDLLARDRARDLATPARPLARDRSATRYTTKERARRELREGIPPTRHMAPAHPGRPLGAEAAQKKLGLPQAPTVRGSIRLPKGFPVQKNKVIGGGPGAPEWTSPRHVPPEAIKKVTPLRPNGRG